MKFPRSQWTPAFSYPGAILRRVALLSLLSGAISAHAQSFLPPVTINEGAKFSQVIGTGGALATGGALLICEGEPVGKATIPLTVANPWQYLCGKTLPNFGISDIVGFLPGVGALLIQMASDKDADSAVTPADTTPIPFPFINAPIVAIAEVLGPSGFIEYAPEASQPVFVQPGVTANQPGFYVDPKTGQTPIYFIQSDCQPANEHLSTCGIRNQIPPQCGDPGGECGVVIGTIAEPAPWTLLLCGMIALLFAKILALRSRLPHDIPR